MLFCSVHSPDLFRVFAFQAIPHAEMSMKTEYILLLLFIMSVTIHIDVAFMRVGRSFRSAIKTETDVRNRAKHLQRNARILETIRLLKVMKILVINKKVSESSLTLSSLWGCCHHPRGFCPRNQRRIHR